ncbi:protein angel isoform X1 [Amblyomma americanum]
MINGPAPTADETDANAGADGGGSGNARADGIPWLGWGRARYCPVPAPQYSPLPRVQPQPPAMWPGAACRLIRPPVFALPPAVGHGALLGHQASAWHLSAVAAASPAAQSWICQGRAQLHASIHTMGTRPDLLPDASQLAPPCNKRRPEPLVVSDVTDPSVAHPKRRFADQPPETSVTAIDAMANDYHLDGNVGPPEVPPNFEAYDPVAAAANVQRKVRQSRYWVPTDLGQLHSGSAGGRGKKSEDMVFTVLSYNVLAQGLLEDNPYLYQHCSEEVLQWPLRRQNLLSELREANADILCLQELQEDHYEADFRPELEKMGYGCLYKQRTGDKRDGCGIFFKKSMFELDRFEPVEYSRSEVPVLDRDNVALIAMLKPQGRDIRLGGDFRLCVSTTHLLFNPRRGDIKLAQLCLLLAEIDRLAACGQSLDGTPLYFPILLCGDMNSEPHSPLYTFLTRGSLCYEGLLSGDVSGQSDGANRGRYVPLDDCLRQLNISGASRYLQKPATDANLEGSKIASADAALEDVVMDDAVTGDRAKDEPVASGAIVNNESMVTDAKDSPTRSTNANSGPTEGSHPEAPSAEATTAAKGSDPNSPQSPTKKSRKNKSRVVSHCLNLVSAYKHNIQGGNAEVTTHHQRASCTVDYIFYSVKRKETAVKNGQVVHNRVIEGPLRLLSTYRLMSQKQLVAVGGLPNEVQSSDHLPLMAKFLLRPPV